MDQTSNGQTAAAVRGKRAFWGVHALLVLASVVYGACLFTGLDRWGRADWDQFSFRYETPRVAVLRDGQLPAWNPYVNGGNVLLAHPHCPALSPWYLPTLMLGAPLGLRVQVVLFVILGATGMAALLRGWQVSPAGCLLGGIVLMMGSHFALHITEGHLEWCVLGLMPWVMWCLVQAKRDWRLILLGAVLLASAVLHGSVYVVAVFVPLMAIWAPLESLRTRSWRAAVGCLGLLVLALLLSAVVVLPRMEFLRAYPRETGPAEWISPKALGHMLLDPRQAAMYRATRDVRNPPQGVLARILPSRATASPPRQETLKWYRLDLVLSTTSDWTDVRFVDDDFRRFPYILILGEPAGDMTQARLNSLRPSEEWLAIQNLDMAQTEVVKRATLYVRLPDKGDVNFVVTRGNFGRTQLTVRHEGEVLLEATHATMVPGDLKNRRVFSIPRAAILGEEAGEGPAVAGRWYRIEERLQTTADWCDVQVVNAPYLFSIHDAPTQPQAGVRPSMSSLVTGSPAPGEEATAIRATLYFQCPAKDHLRVATIQGRIGSSTLQLRSPRGDLLPTSRKEVTEPGGEKTHEYVLANGLIRERLRPLPNPPWRWQLDRLGMVFDWHEYGCYMTWLGLGLAVVGLVVSFRRQWPLLATGGLAAWTALGAAAPVDLWALRKLLPMLGSLQVSSRFLLAVVFVLAVAAGYGLDRVGRWAGRIGGRRLRRLVEGTAVVAVYAELAAVGSSLFCDIFVCPPVHVPVYKQFAQRYKADYARRAAMYSAHYPYLMANSGVLRHYENIAVPRGAVRITSDPDYRGEVYLTGSRGTARISRWSMSRVTVALELRATDRLVFNQNYAHGWKAVRRTASGGVRKLPAEPGPGGLVSLQVGPGDREVEFYYVPPGFLPGAVLSAVAGAACLGLLLGGGLGRRRGFPGVQPAAAVRAWCVAAVRWPGFAYAASALALNVPFAICHPARPLVDVPLVRSLAINVVLFLAPGVPLVGLLAGRGWLRRHWLLWTVAGSLAVFFSVMLLGFLLGRPPDACFAWNATWLVTNVTLLLRWATGGPPGWPGRLRERHMAAGLFAFAVAYVLLLYGATSVVPAMEDLDYEGQGTAPSLLTRFEARLLTDRNTTYYYAHPPLLHFCMAGAFLYFDQLHHLDVFEEAWQRVQAAERGISVEAPVAEFYRLPSNRLVRRPPGQDPRATRHRIDGPSVGGDYLVDPPVPQWGDRIRVRDFEVQVLYDHYRHHPRRLATRAVNVFLAALAVGVMTWWLGRMTGLAWLGLLAALAFITSPEMFVRSAYGGYTAINNFLLVEILLLAEQWAARRRRATWGGCVLAGVLAGLANQKLVVMPAALVTWEILRLAPAWRAKEVLRALLHPVAVGFAAGTGVFWLWGLTVSPRMFWLEHVRHHLVDRVTHTNPLGYTNYPTVSGLWLELCRHTGYVLLPAGAAALGLLCWAKTAEKGAAGADRVRGWRGPPGLWAIWALLTAVAFSLIDWRQTKHLMPILLPLHLAPARCARKGNVALMMAGVLFAGLLLWNAGMIRLLAEDFTAFQVTPAW